MSYTVAKLVVDCLESQGVEYVFGIPGAKIDAVFDALADSSIRVILCRHEQNAAFMAAMHGRLTGQPGVVIVTSGPGVGNLCTGLLTANTEGDPVIAIAGNVMRSMHFKESHQCANNVGLLREATKSAVEIDTVSCVPEQILNAFRVATMPRQGACLLSFPQDLLSETCELEPLTLLHSPSYGPASIESIHQAKKHIDQAKNIVLFLGEEASLSENAKAINRLLANFSFPMVSTYQAAGTVFKENVNCFVGRVGLFSNQPGDIALSEADLIITIGFNPVEYDPECWNGDNHAKIIHISYIPADIHYCYLPIVECLGDIAATLTILSGHLNGIARYVFSESVARAQKEYFDSIDSGKDLCGEKGIHPLSFIYHLRTAINDDAYILCDIGSHYMWMARYFLIHKPRHLMFSNGQQTLGVALPYAMATRLIFPCSEIISISGDGGFLFSANELETAVREKLKVIHFIWTDGSYNMVKIQQIKKYKRSSAIELGPIDIVLFAQSFGATGLLLESIDQFDDVLQMARKATGPVLINVNIDYSDNERLIALKDPYQGH